MSGCPVRGEKMFVGPQFERWRQNTLKHRGKNEVQDTGFVLLVQFSNRTTWAFETGTRKQSAVWSSETAPLVPIPMEVGCRGDKFPPGPESALFFLIRKGPGQYLTPG